MGPDIFKFIKISMKISTSIKVIEAAILQMEYIGDDVPDFDLDTFRAAIKIGSTAILDAMFKLQCEEEMAINDMIKMTESCAKDIRQLVKTYTNIDTLSL